MVVEQLKNKMSEIEEKEICIDILNDILVILTRKDVVSFEFDFECMKLRLHKICFACIAWEYCLVSPLTRWRVTQPARDSS